MAAAAADPREFSKVVDADHDLNFQMSGGASAVKDVDSAPGTAFGWDYAKGVHTSSGPVFPLTCAAQQYAWGKVGSSSKVAQMKAADAGFSVDEAQTYAEYWMGTHPNAPSRTPDGTTLAAFLAANPGALGDKLGAGAAASTGELPYLFKVLSIGKALSIQAHPDKKLAEKCHAERPDVYKDPNHKPEMALALTPMEALCQFRAIPEIVAHLGEFPEFRAMVGEAAAASLEAPGAGKAELKAAFSAFMAATPELLEAQLGAMLARLRALAAPVAPLQALLLRLQDQFPGDIGIFCPLLLNYVTLEPGQALFLGANEPHAYLSGDIAECMACSDNVVRSGLTPKFKDVDLLCEMLTYKTGAPKIYTGETVDHCTSLYTPPASVPEFEMMRVSVPADYSYLMPTCATPQILLVVGGSGGLSKDADRATALKVGTTMFASANAVITLRGGAEGLEVFTARANESIE
jgi:mannose-6-phosphate isomerase